MKRRQPASGINAPGQDSFLDVVCNLVGILIILVMVVSARASGAAASVHAEKVDVHRPAVSAADVAMAAAAERSVQASVFEIEEQRLRVGREAELKHRERERLLLLIGAARREIAEQRAGLDANSQARFDAQRAALALQQQLAELERAKQSLVTEEAAPEVLHHYPTPLARTVFGHEEHFRLSGGKICYVPFNEVVAELKREAPQKVWKLKDAREVTETLGPIKDFRMRYTLARTEIQVETKFGPASQDHIELDHFVLLPVREDLGEPLAQAMLPGAQFRTYLDRVNPKTTTITIWTYPDSYNEFRNLRQQLLQMGFSTAARPLPAGHPIGGAPSGSRSSAE